MSWCCCGKGSKGKDVPDSANNGTDVKMNVGTEEVMVASKTETVHSAPPVTPLNDQTLKISANKADPKKAAYAYNSYLDIPFIDEDEDDEET